MKTRRSSLAQQPGSAAQQQEGQPQRMAAKKKAGKGGGRGRTRVVVQTTVALKRAGVQRGAAGPSKRRTSKQQAAAATASAAAAASPTSSAEAAASASAQQGSKRRSRRSLAAAAAGCGAAGEAGIGDLSEETLLEIFSNLASNQSFCRWVLPPGCAKSQSVPELANLREPRFALKPWACCATAPLARRETLPLVCKRFRNLLAQPGPVWEVGAAPGPARPHVAAVLGQRNT